MNRTNITFQGSVITLVFGSWVMGQLIKSGYALASLQEVIQTNPFEFFPKLIYLAAINGTPGKDLTAYNEADFYDYVDEVGGIGSDEVIKVVNCFSNSLGMDVSKKKQATQRAKK